MTSTSCPHAYAPMSGPEYLKTIIKCGGMIYEAAQITPLQPMDKLSARLHNRVWIKREDRQPVHSFKLRGAFAMMASLSPEEKAAGVVAASAGNHAQGVALSGQKLGVRTLIVMPKSTPSIKVDAVRGFGGEVLLHGANFDEAKAKAMEVAQKEGMTFIPPFDHPLVIAGQGTLALEMLQQHAELHKVFVPIGGGGMAAGVAVLIKQLMPEIQVIGVESQDSASMQAALRAGHPVKLERVGLFADGVAVKQVGDETFRLCRAYLDDIVTVDSDEICAAMKDIFENVRAVAEPSGALALAGLKKYVHLHQLKDENVAAVLSGANLNFHTLRYVSERCEIGENREALLAVTIPERKGTFLKFCHLLGGRSVTEFNYRYADKNEACIFVGVRTTDEAEKAEIMHSLMEAGFGVEDMTDDDIAKTHIRYMIGGRATSTLPERLYTFEFPEQQGALEKFLMTLGTHWNISLFHYRAHGADYGNILCAFQFEDDNLSQFREHLDRLGYPYQEVSQSKAYRFFLK